MEQQMLALVSLDNNNQCGKNPIFIKCIDGTKKKLEEGQETDVHAGDVLYLVVDEYPFQVKEFKEEKKILKRSISNEASKPKLKAQLDDDSIEDFDDIPAPKLKKQGLMDTKKKPKPLLKDPSSDTDEEMTWKTLSAKKAKNLDTSKDEELALALASEEQKKNIKNNNNNKGETHNKKNNSYSTDSSPSSPSRSAKVKANKHMQDEYGMYNKSSDEDFSEKTKSKKTSPKAKPKKQICKYGASCYRKNPDHFVEFSHPHLAD